MSIPFGSTSESGEINIYRASASTFLCFCFSIFLSLALSLSLPQRRRWRRRRRRRPHPSQVTRVPPVAHPRHEDARLGPAGGRRHGFPSALHPPVDPHCLGETLAASFRSSRPSQGLHGAIVRAWPQHERCAGVASESLGAHQRCLHPRPRLRRAGNVRPAARQRHKTR